VAVCANTRRIRRARTVSRVAAFAFLSSILTLQLRATPSCRLCLLSPPPSLQVQFPDKLKCTVLYALRYESQANNLPVLRGLLRAHARMSNYSENVLEVIDRVLGYSGSHVRTWPLFRDGDALSLKNVVKTIQSNVKGIDNIYTQHKPLVHEILQHLFAGELKTQQFPFADSGSPRTCVHPPRCTRTRRARARPGAQQRARGLEVDGGRCRGAHCGATDRSAQRSGWSTPVLIEIYSISSSHRLIVFILVLFFVLLCFVVAASTVG